MDLTSEKDVYSLVVVVKAEICILVTFCKIPLLPPTRLGLASQYAGSQWQLGIECVVWKMMASIGAAAHHHYAEFEHPIRSSPSQVIWVIMTADMTLKSSFVSIILCGSSQTCELSRLYGKFLLFYFASLWRCQLTPGRSCSSIFRRPNSTWPAAAHSGKY